MAAKSASAAISPRIPTGLVPPFDFFGSMFPAFLTPPSTRAAANAFAQFPQTAPLTLSETLRVSAAIARAEIAAEKTIAIRRIFLIEFPPLQ